MKFRRKSAADPVDVTEDEETGGPGEAAETEQPGRAETGGGPLDVAEISDDDGVERVDLGSLLIAAQPGLELRLQVDEASQEVQSVVIAGPDGAVEVRAFAAPRHGDLWSQARPQISAETAQRGGTATEREGRFGPELVCQRPVQGPDGRSGMQPSLIVGFNGDRWFLRATFLGKPAQADDPGEWYDALAAVVVNRGKEAMPPGDPLPLTLPASARREA